MRIIAGELGGRVLKTVKRPQLRPTSDRVREALFSSLESDGVLEGASVLDLYAGTGSLGIEAVSRGAARAYFVESDRATAAQLKTTISELGLESRTKLVVADAIELLRSGAHGLKSGAPYDLIFADPPYEDHPGLVLAEKLVGAGLIRNGSFFVLESAKRSELAPFRPGALSLSPALQKVKVYGDTQLHFFRFENLRTVDGSAKEER